MAGAGFKDFAVGEVLTASDVDTYLMQQSVMRFADSAARGSALGTAVGTAVALAEGMVSYLDDVNQMQVYDGSGWTSPLPGIGTNVVQTVKTDTFSTTSSTFVDVTGLTVAITPSTATAKVLVVAQFHMGFQSTAGSQAAFFRLNGGNSDDYIGATAGSRSRVAAGLIENQMATTSLAWMQPQTLVYLDSPASASPVTYALQARREGGGTAYVNRPHTWTNVAGIWSVPASITAIEVAA